MGLNTVEHEISLLRSALEQTRGMDRRAFIKALSGLAAGSVFLPGLVELAQAADQKPVTILGWGGPWKDAIMKAYGDPFAKKSGIPVSYVSPYDYSKVKAMDQAKQQLVDLVEVSEIDVYRVIDDGIAIPIDFSVVDKSALDPGQLVFPNGIGATTVDTIMIYNKQKWPGDSGPKNWADFWDLKRFPGQRALPRVPYPTLEFALLADGVAKKDLYPLDIDRAFKKLAEIKDNVTWFETGSEPQQMISNGESDITSIWTSRAGDSIINQGLPFEYVWEDGGSEGNTEAWFVLRNSPNPKGAMQFVDFAGRAEAQAAFARIIFSAPLNLKAYDFLDKSIAERLPSYPANASKMFKINYDYWIKNQDPVTQRFEDWLRT